MAEVPGSSLPRCSSDIEDNAESRLWTILSSVVAVRGGIGVGRGYVRLQRGLRRHLGRRQLQRWRAVW